MNGPLVVIFKTQLLKMAANVMIVEFCTHPPLFSSGGKFLNLFVQFFGQIQKITNHYVNFVIFGLEQPCFKQQREYKLASSPLYECMAKIDN